MGYGENFSRPINKGRSEVLATAQDIDNVETLIGTIFKVKNMKSVDLNLDITQGTSTAITISAYTGPTIDNVAKPVGNIVSAAGSNTLSDGPFIFPDGASYKDYLLKFQLDGSTNYMKFMIVDAADGTGVVDLATVTMA